MGTSPCSLRGGEFRRILKVLKVSLGTFVDNSEMSNSTVLNFLKGEMWELVFSCWYGVLYRVLDDEERELLRRRLHSIADKL